MSGPGATAPNRDLVDLALQVLPELRAARDRLAEDPEDVVRRLPRGTERVPRTADQSLRVLENGVATIDALEAEGSEVSLDRASEEGLEAVVFQLARPAIFMHDGDFEDPPPPWDRILEPFRAMISAASTRVGRIELDGLPQLPYAGTGFLVGEDVVMTNCHVAVLFAQTDTHGRWTFKPDFGASISMVDDPDPLHFANPLPGFDVTDLIGVHERLDLALLRVEPTARGNALPEPLTVAAQDPGPLARRKLFVIGYPMFDPDADRDLLDLIFGDDFNVKRLQPGNAMATPPGATPVITPCSDAGIEDVMFHDASTLKGNSGSAVFDLELGKVVGLHFSGAQWRFNRAVALWKLVDDPLLARAEVRFG
jgi:hypothetical protein